MRIVNAHENMRMNTTPRPRKKSTNISLDVSLVEEAKTLNINLSSTLNSALEDVVRLKRQAMWREENKTAIEAVIALWRNISYPGAVTLRVIK